MQEAEKYAVTEEPFLLSILHKGTVDIALLFLIRILAGPERLPWATLISEALALLAGIRMLARNDRKLKAKNDIDI